MDVIPLRHNCWCAALVTSQPCAPLSQRADHGMGGHRLGVSSNHVDQLAQAGPFFWLLKVGRRGFDQWHGRRQEAGPRRYCLRAAG